MYDVAVEYGGSLLAQYGLLVLLVVFGLEGALVGKLIPTRALFVAAVLAVGFASAAAVVAVLATVVLGATLGQLGLFVAVRYTDRSPGTISAGDAAERRLAGWFDRWGLPAVAVSNTLPVARGSLTVPAAMSGTTPARFSASSLAGTAVYACGLLVVATGVDVLLSTL